MTVLVVRHVIYLRLQRCERRARSATADSIRVPSPVHPTCPNRGASRYLLKLSALCLFMDELCHNEMSRDHDAPLEYLRILASLKLRFGLATLVTAHGALPVCSPMVALDTHLPNGCVGHSASQWFRGSSSFPINVTARPAAIPVVHNTHPLQAAFQLHMLCWSTSNNVAIFWTPIRIQVVNNDGAVPQVEPN